MAIGKERTLSDNRFNIGYVALALMIGIALILNYFSHGDLHLVLSVFFIGLAIILFFLAFYYGKKNYYLAGFGVILLFLGLISTFTRPQGPNIDIGLLMGGFLVIIALAFLGYLYINRQKKEV